MINIIIKKNNGPVQYRKRKLSGSGFIILFAVTLSSIILAVALGVTNIALKEVKFGTSAKDTNNAFFSADTGIECALMNDKPPTKFPTAGPATAITCASTVPTYSSGSNTGLYNFIVINLGSANTSCAKVSVFKDAATSPPYTITRITSKGYNIGDASCNSTNPDRIEREIVSTY